MRHALLCVSRVINGARFGAEQIDKLAQDCVRGDGVPHAMFVGLDGQRGREEAGRKAGAPTCDDNAQEGERCHALRLVRCHAVPCCRQPCSCSSVCGVSYCTRAVYRRTMAKLPGLWWQGHEPIYRYMARASDCEHDRIPVSTVADVERKVPGRVVHVPLQRLGTRLRATCGIGASATDRDQFWRDTSRDCADAVRGERATKRFAAARSLFFGCSRGLCGGSSHAHIPLAFVTHRMPCPTNHHVRGPDTPHGWTLRARPSQQRSRPISTVFADRASFSNRSVYAGNRLGLRTLAPRA